ncbi:MAG: methyltransferase type 11, partial [Comamonas sp.]
VGFELGIVMADDHRAAGKTVESAAHVFEKFDHNLAVFIKRDRAHAFMGRRVALHFSGGKDSLACLLLLRPFVMQGLPVYWVDTGDCIPETREVVEWSRAWVPDFRVVQADVHAWKAVHGMPSDATTAQSSWMGAQYGMTDVKLVGRFDCCWSNLMLPMHERMVADGVEVVIRGTKLADTGKVPAHGQTETYEVLLPLMAWSHAQVFEYLERSGAPVNPVYESFKAISAPECLGCSAWWDDGKAGYLKARHPKRVHEYAVSLQTIRAELMRRVNDLDNELKECVQ